MIKGKRGFGALAVILTVLILVILCSFLVAILSGVVMKTTSDLTNAVTNNAQESIPIGNGSIAFKNITQTTFGNVNASAQQLSFFSWIWIVAMIIGTLIAAYTLKPSSITIFCWFIGGAALFLCAVFLSRAYEDLYNGGGFMGTALHGLQSGTSFLIIQLPMVLVMLTFVGGIILYMRMKRADEE